MTAAARLRKWAEGEGRKVEFERRQVTGGSLAWFVTATVGEASMNLKIAGAPTVDLEAASRDVIQSLEAAGEIIEA